MTAVPTRITDLITPEAMAGRIFDAAIANSAILNSGLAFFDSTIQNAVRFGGDSFKIDALNDLDYKIRARRSKDTKSAKYGGAADPTPQGITEKQMTGVRLLCNQSWGEAELTRQITGVDTISFVANRVGAWWSNEMQEILVSTIKGILANNAADPTGSEHVKGDLDYDITGNGAGKTGFSYKTLVGAKAKMGMLSENLKIILCHPDIYHRVMAEQQTPGTPQFNTQMTNNIAGMRVIKSNLLPKKAGGVYETWLVGERFFRLAASRDNKLGSFKIEELEGAGNGGGARTVWSRYNFCIHPNWHTYATTPVPTGGPTNAELEDATAWKRVANDRLSIPFVRFVTKEV